MNSPKAGSMAADPSLRAVCGRVQSFLVLAEDVECHGGQPEAHPAFASESWQTAQFAYRERSWPPDCVAGQPATL